MSHSSISLKCVDNVTDGMVALPLDCQALHSLQVLMMLGISFITSCESPAFLIKFVIDFAGACHQRRCSFRSSLSITALLLLRSARSDCVTSNLLQSEGLSIPEPES